MHTKVILAGTERLSDKGDALSKYLGARGVQHIRMPIGTGVNWSEFIAHLSETTHLLLVLGDTDPDEAARAQQSVFEFFNIIADREADPQINVMFVNSFGVSRGGNALEINKREIDRYQWLFDERHAKLPVFTNSALVHVPLSQTCPSSIFLSDLTKSPGAGELFRPILSESMASAA